MIEEDNRIVELRRHRGSLVLLGLGVAAFGVWSVLKLVLYIVFREEFFRNAMGEEYFNIPFVRIGTYVILFIVLGLDLLFRLYIGMSARKEGLQKKSGKLYLVLTGLILLYSMFAVGSALVNVTTQIDYYDSWLDFVIETLVDFSSGIISLELLYAGIRVKKLEKELAGEQQIKD